MPFKKGQSGNPKGMPKGTKNKKTLQWEIFNEYILNGGLEKYQQEMDKLKGKEYITAFQNGLEYHKPKQARTEVIGDPTKPLVVTTIKLDDNTELTI